MLTGCTPANVRFQGEILQGGEKKQINNLSFRAVMRFDFSGIKLMNHQHSWTSQLTAAIVLM